MSWECAFILGVLASFIASIIFQFFFQLGIRPEIDIRTEDPQIKLSGQRTGQPKHRFIHLVIENKRAWVPWKFVTERQTAWNCEVSYEFFSALEPNKKLIQDKVIARWAAAIEPILPALDPHRGINSQAVRQTIPDPSKLPFGRKYDLHGGTQENIDLIIKIEGQQECYVFSNESYLLGWKNQNWKLGIGEYLVKVQARSGQITKQKTFKIINEGTTLEDVFVETYSPTDNS